MKVIKDDQNSEDYPNKTVFEVFDIKILDGKTCALVFDYTKTNKWVWIDLNNYWSQYLH